MNSSPLFRRFPLPFKFLNPGWPFGGNDETRLRSGPPQAVDLRKSRLSDGGIPPPKALLTPETPDPEASISPTPSGSAETDDDSLQLAPGRARVLVAEDNSINQRVALLQLGKLGYQADAVSNGQEALEALKKIPYDIIVMDCQMPELDGYEASRQIRRDYPDRRIYIIALTANTTRGNREKCLAAGMDDYITKPLHAIDLKVAMDRWEVLAAMGFPLRHPPPE